MFNNEKDEKFLGRLAASEQNSIAELQSISTCSLPLIEKNNNNEEAVSSVAVWNCEITPMTTRPHFQISPTNQRPIRRIRSRSLGADVERNLSYNYGKHTPPMLVSSTAGLLAPGTLDPSSKENYSPILRIDDSHSSSSSLLKLTSDRSNSNRASISNSNRSTNQRIEEEEMINNPIWICIMYGMINATIVLPVLMSFGSIIYRDDAYVPYMPVLVKLTVVSGIIHQLCFSTFSTLPFAVGQVQDAGLIFLSSMATQIVKICQYNNHTDEVLLATTTVALSIATALLGLGLVLVGYLQLAQYVQLLPTCVVGGYLAFIGWFCGIAGVGLMAGTSELTLYDVKNKFIYIFPGVLGGLMIYLAVTRLRHMAALPTSIMMEIILFYIILWCTGVSVQEATTGGWIRDMDPPPAWYHTWDYIKLNKVDWTVFPQLALTELGMIFVVALSSSLDVAAIELEMKRPLNYNHELKMVGLSNIVSGLTGGYTGSYIFSQSIFSLRAGIRSRLAGYVLALCQIIIVVLPFPILAYVPNFFFGSLLSMICIDLMYEWLWDVRNRLSQVEYIICLATFASIQLLGVEYGILAGVGLYLGCKKIGLNLGVSKFSTHEDEDEVDDDDDDSINDLQLSVEDKNESTGNGYHQNKNYGAI